MMAAIPAAAATKLSADSDLRAVVDEWEEVEASIHRLAASVRQTFADSKGDRLALYVLVETEDNFAEWSLDELYARYKGPLGKYNITAGRFALPYGLHASIDPTRFLYETHSMKAMGVHVDNGLMLTGVLGRYDYAASITQGLGGHHLPEFPGYGLFISRLGMALGDTDEFQLGLSGVLGRTAMHENRDKTVGRALGALDATVYMGPMLFRAELNAGHISDSLFISVFTGLEYPLLPRLDIILTSLNSRYHRTFDNHVFAGAAWKLRWFTIRGGYQYAFQSRPENRISFQIYRLFTHTL
jgi:hypothetical protein